MYFTKTLILISYLFSSTHCQHNYFRESVPQVQSLDYQDFKVLVTQSQPLELWSSKARQKALGGIYIPPPPVPSKKVLFGTKFDEAKKLIRIFDVRSDDDFSRSNLSMDPNVKAPVIHIFWQNFFTAAGEIEFGIERQLEEKNVTKDSIIIVLCNKAIRAQTMANVLQSIGYQRVLIFEGQYEPWQQCE